MVPVYRRLLSLGLLVCIASPTFAETVLSTDFETDPVADGWIHDAGWEGTGNTWTTQEARSWEHSIQIQMGYWRSPELFNEPTGLYKVTLYAKGGAGDVGWGGGVRPLPFNTTSDWTQYEILMRKAQCWLTSHTSIPVYVDDADITRITAQEAEQLLARAFDGIPPFDFPAYQPPNRHRYIPRTISKLSGGGNFKIVMLGDSIVSDTCNSFFDLHIERMYPGTQVEIIPSTRGATGCWWFKEENRVQLWVLGHNPDLVMIGGISQYDDIDSIREVIQQIREGDSEIEIVLMSEAAGRKSPYDTPEDLAPIDPDGTDYRSLLWKLSEEQQVGFVEMTRPWSQFIVDSGLSYDYFLRDGLHTNYYGCILLGRILESYFAPTVFAEVVGRHVFYNNSAWDGNDPLANPSDDSAIDTSKSALLGGQTATFANYTSYVRGINGVMIDVWGLWGTPTAGDFEVEVSGVTDGDDAGDYVTTLTPASVTVRAGAGVGGSDRVTLIFGDTDMYNKRWCRFRVKASANTGLPSDEVFYWGLAIGETGNNPANAYVNASDRLGARTHSHSFLDPAPVTDEYDFNRDRLVNAADRLIQRSHPTHFLNCLKLVTGP